MTLIHGDCIESMAAMEPESVDAIVTDPPYGLEFMGKEWDGADGFRRSLNANDVGRDNVFGRQSARGPEYRTETGRREQSLKKRAVSRPEHTYQDWSEQWAEAALRVAKPSAYLLAFGGTRTVHRMTCALEDAGWIIRDMLVWGYASGFPKSKASLKPAWEPIVMARKPGPLRMLAIDACRIPTDDDRGRPPRTPNALYGDGKGTNLDASDNDPAGRWPANVVLTKSCVMCSDENEAGPCFGGDKCFAIFDGGIEGVVGGGETQRSAPASGPTWEGPSGSPSRSPFNGMGDTEPQFYGDTGTYSRFFLIPKAARSDREPVLRPDGHDPLTRFTTHPTVKPVDLMRHLVRLVTPTGGIVLDPFLGSGSTGIAAEMEGFAWIGIEREAEYVAIAEARLNGTQKGMAL